MTNKNVESHTMTTGGFVCPDTIVTPRLGGTLRFQRAERTFEFRDVPCRKHPEVASAESRNVVAISNIGAPPNPVS